MDKEFENIFKCMLTELKAARAWRDLPNHLPPAKDMETHQWLMEVYKDKREAFDAARKETDKILKINSFEDSLVIDP